MKKILCIVSLLTISCAAYSLIDATVQEPESVVSTVSDDDDIFDIVFDDDDIAQVTRLREPQTPTQRSIERVLIRVALVVLQCKEYCRIVLDYTLNNRCVDYFIQQSMHKGHYA